MDVKNIPGTQGFLASSDGRIFDKTGTIRPQYTNLDGYKTASVLLESGKWRTYGVHRLVMLAHSPILETDKLEVNHKDFDLTNNDKSNLEWVTPKHNNVYNVVMQESPGRPTILARTPDGNNVFFLNLKEASEKTAFDIELVWNALKSGSILDGWLFKHHGRNDKIPESLRKDNFPGGRGKGVLEKSPVDVLCWNTKQFLAFDSLHECAIYFKTSPSHVYQCISDNDNVKLFKRNFIIVRKGTTFPDINNGLIEKLKSPTGKQVLAFHEKIGLCIFETASSFIREADLSKKAVSVSLKQGRLREINGWWFCYNEPHLIPKIKEVIQNVQVLV